MIGTVSGKTNFRPRLTSVLAFNVLKVHHWHEMIIISEVTVNSAFLDNLHKLSLNNEGHV